MVSRAAVIVVIEVRVLDQGFELIRGAEFVSRFGFRIIVEVAGYREVDEEVVCMNTTYS